MRAEKSTIFDSVEFTVRDAAGRVKQSGCVTHKAGKTWEFKGNYLYNSLLTHRRKPLRVPFLMGIWRIQ